MGDGLTAVELAAFKVVFTVVSVGVCAAASCLADAWNRWDDRRAGRDRDR